LRKLLLNNGLNNENDNNLQTETQIIYAIASQHYPYQIILFDMDGVLLQPRGYHTALQTSVKRIGQALGVPEG
jgi:hypothetical protein